jgi:rhodanese-related sulfurtransferase
MEIEPDGVRYVLDGDRTAVFVDARDPDEPHNGSLPGARGIPLAEVNAAKDDGRLPMEDHNTRIVVFGRDGDQARAVAEALAKNAFHNVAFFGGTPDRLTALAPEKSGARASRPRRAGMRPRAGSGTGSESYRAVSALISAVAASPGPRARMISPASAKSRSRPAGATCTRIRVVSSPMLQLAWGVPRGMKTVVLAVAVMVSGPSRTSIVPASTWKV